MIRAVRSLFCVLLLAGCESIVGIEDHTFVSSDATQCQAYCDMVMANCTGVNAVYSEPETCLGVCKALPPGGSVEPTYSNTVACRLQQAKSAEREPAYYCPRAGPGGGLPGMDATCGSDCESYCSLFASICPDQAATQSSCEQQCAPLRDDGTFNVVANYSGDTLQCRLVHVSAATASDSMMHCGHSQLFPTTPCTDDGMGTPDCQYFCKLEMAACSGANAAYESTAQCLDVCKNLPQGTNADQSGNTVACRVYHSYNALLMGVAHCPHTGPGGDGHCGADQPDDTGNCFAYCTLLSKACGQQFSDMYQGDQTTCQKDCSTNLPDAAHDKGYRVMPPPTGNTLGCRLLHVSRAFSDPMECAAAIGGDPCK